MAGSVDLQTTAVPAQPSSRSAGPRMLRGAVRVLASDALFLPTGLLAASFLTRTLGPEGYGLFTLAAALIGWIDWVITAAFSRAIIKFISEAEDWRAVGTTAVQLHLVVGATAAALLSGLARPIATFLHEPVLATYLRLFALGIPVYSLACAYRHILVGLGDFRERALASAGRALSAPLLIIVLVQMGLSVTGAILGNIGACVVEIVVARYYVRPSLFGRSNFPLRQLWQYAVPLFLFGASLRLFSNLDLFALKALGATAAQAGIYGAAQNLAVVPGYVVFSFAPLLLSALSRTLREGGESLAREMSANTVRAVIASLPFIALLAGAAPDIVSLLFGERFAAAAPICAILALGVLGRASVAISTTVLTAIGKPAWTAALALPLVPLALIGHWWLIPGLGSRGACLVTAILSLAAAFVGCGLVYRFWAVLPQRATILRSLALSGPTYILALMWPAPGLWLLIKLPAIAAAVLLASLLCGELTAEEKARVRSTLPALSRKRQYG